MDVGDGVRDGPEAGREPVLVEAVAQPGSCVRDPTRVLDGADPALEGNGLHERSVTSNEGVGGDLRLNLERGDSTRTP